MPRSHGKLVAHYGEIVSLYTRDGLEPKQIAERFGVNPPAIRARLKEAGVYAVDPKAVANGSKGGAPKRKLSGDNRIPTAHLVRVDRDPCTFCGVRGDVPCRHRRIWA